jgi:hypothetical protein
MTRMVLLAVAVLPLLVGGVCEANLGAVFGRHGGAVEALPEHATVRMVAETVDATIDDMHARVECSYRFLNEGPATVVTMGFPEMEAGMLDHGWPEAELEKLTLTADGQAVPTTLRPGAMRHMDGSKPEGTPEAELPPATRWAREGGAFGVAWRWHVAEVPFAEGQERQVQVRYEQRLGEFGGVNGYWFRYWAGTAASWKGDLDEATFTFHLDLPADAARVGVSPDPTSRDEETVTWRFAHYEGDPPDFRVFFDLGTALLEVNGKNCGAMYHYYRVYKDNEAAGQLVHFAKILGGETKHEKGSQEFEARVRGKTIVVTAGESRCTVDGTPCDLGAQAEKLGDNDVQVRLGPIVRALGGTLTSDLKTMKISVTLPEG